MRLDNWFLGVQRALGHYVVVEANYIGSRGGNMYYRWDINRFAGDLLDGRLDRIMPGFSAVNYAQAVDESHYNGFTFAARPAQRPEPRSRLHLRQGHRPLELVRRRHARPDAYGPDDQDEGPSDHDIRQKLAVSLNWKLPGPSSGAGKAILGGWQLAGVLLAQSGTPYTVFCAASPRQRQRHRNSGCDYNADGTNFDRPNIPSFGDSQGGSNDDFLNGIFSASDFPVPGLGQNGTLGRNTFAAPATSTST